MNQIQRRCCQVTWDGCPSQSCKRPARNRSRNCSNLKRTKRSHWLRLRDKKIISSRFVGGWEECGELRSRLVSRGYESSHTDPASLFAATPSVVATKIAVVLGLAQDVEMVVADISGAFLHAVLEKHFFVTPPDEYREPGVVWKIQRYLHADKRAPRGVAGSRREHDAGIGLRTLGVRTRVLREEGSHTKTQSLWLCMWTISRVLGSENMSTTSVCNWRKTLKPKRVEFIENGKSVLFLVDYITKFKDKITLKIKDAYVDNTLTLMGMGAANRQAHRWYERSQQQTATKRCWKDQRPKRIGQLWVS